MTEMQVSKMILHGCCSWQEKGAGQVAHPESGLYTKQSTNTVCRIIFCLEPQAGSSFIISLPEV